MTSSHIPQIFLRITVQNQIRIAQWVIVDKVVQFRLLRHSHIQCILNPGAVDGNLSPIPEQQLHAAGVHVELAGSFIVLHICVLSALRHLYSCLLYTSWGINRDPGAALTLDFGREVLLDELRITERADFPHDNYWVKATVEFSDGSRLDIPLAVSYTHLDVYKRQIPH